jgi:hypothetical protein
MPNRFQMQPRDRGFLGIPTAAQWHQLTTIKTLGISHSRSNPLMLAIDTALTEFYHAETAPFDAHAESLEARDSRNQITATMLLGVAINAQLWIESKVGKSSNRRPLVTCLIKECLRVLCARPFTDYGIAIPNGPAFNSAALISQRAGLRWKRIRDGVKHLGLAKSGKSLGDHYWLETNLGGANPQHRQGRAAHEAFTSGAEKFFFNQVRKGAVGGTRVAYLNPAERRQYKIQFRDGRCHRLAANGRDLEALDEVNGNIVVADAQYNFYSTFGDAPPQGQVWHHSSILSGDSVPFAGGISIFGGLITKLDMMSGHYKPAASQFLWALQALHTRHGHALEGISIHVSFPIEGEEAERPDGTIMRKMRTLIYNDGARYWSTQGDLKPDQEGTGYV